MRRPILAYRRFDAGWIEGTLRCNCPKGIAVYFPNQLSFWLANFSLSSGFSSANLILMIAQLLPILTEDINGEARSSIAVRAFPYPMIQARRSLVIQTGDPDNEFLWLRTDVLVASFEQSVSRLRDGGNTIDVHDGRRQSGIYDAPAYTDRVSDYQSLWTRHAESVCVIGGELFLDGFESVGAEPRTGCILIRRYGVEPNKGIKHDPRWTILRMDQRTDNRSSIVLSVEGLHQTM